MKSILLVCVSHLVVSDSLWSSGLWPTRLLYPWNSLAKNTGVGFHFFLQGIFLTQWLNLDFLHCRQILYHLSHQGKPNRVSNKSLLLESDRPRGIVTSHFTLFLALELPRSDSSSVEWEYITDVLDRFVFPTKFICWSPNPSASERDYIWDRLFTEILKLNLGTRIEEGNKDQFFLMWTII